MKGQWTLNALTEVAFREQQAWEVGIRAMTPLMGLLRVRVNPRDRVRMFCLCLLADESLKLSPDPEGRI